MKLSIKPAVKRSVLAVSMLAGLSACGGGGDGGGGGGNTAQTPGQNPTAADGSVPASAMASTAAFVNYLNTLPKNETEEPLNAASVTPPTTDTEESTNV